MSKPDGAEVERSTIAYAVPSGSHRAGPNRGTAEAPDEKLRSICCVSPVSRPTCALGQARARISTRAHAAYRRLPDIWAPPLRHSPAGPRQGLAGAGGSEM